MSNIDFVLAFVSILLLIRTLIVLRPAPQLIPIRTRLDRRDEYEYRKVIRSTD